MQYVNQSQLRELRKALPQTQKYGEPLCERSLDAYLILNGDMAREVLLAPEFEVVPHAHVLADIATAKGVNMDATVNSFKHSPLAQEGARHRELRAEHMDWVRRGTPAALEAFERALNGLLAGKLAGAQTFDIVHDFMAPAIDDLFSALCGLSIPQRRGRIPAGACATQVMSYWAAHLSCERLSTINDRIANAENLMRGSDSARAQRAAVLVASSEILQAGLTEGLVKCLLEAQCKPLCELRSWPALESGSVVFVDRICVSDCLIGGRQFKSGEKVILYVGGRNSAAPGGDDTLIFGSGRHTCIGKQLSQAAWGVLGETLAKLRQVWEIDTIEFRERDMALHAFKSVLVNVRHIA